MPGLSDLMLEGSRVQGHRPSPRAVVDTAVWNFTAGKIAEGHWTLLGLWGEAAAVHMALLDEGAGETAVVSLDCPDGRYPSVAQRHPPALRLERAARDLFGLTPRGLPDMRPWLDHGRWAETDPPPRPYDFLPAEGEGLHQVAVGPVHAGIIEPGHFRFTVNGETVVRLEQRFGYAHKGVESLMAGAALMPAARVAGRVSGDSTVAYAFAFARAAEAALGVEPPDRAQWLRALMAELERLANHFGDFGAVCNDAAFPILHAHAAVLRERVLRAADVCFGHRFMRDRIVPGGVASDMAAGSTDILHGLVAGLRQRFPKLVELYDKTTSLQDRTVATGIVKPPLARQYGAGGFVGRASGRPFDARRTLGYPPYDELRFDVPVLDRGDVDARVWIRIREVEQSMSLVEQILRGMPGGPIVTGLPSRAGEGMALVEGFRGDVLAWLRIGGDGKVVRCHLRDPSWFQWPLVEAAVEGNIVADFPLCNKSFNCSYSGHDL
ncbi:MAG: NADH-quinone oxidoreductase subunit C [Alphaproteobacteria bacterium]